MKEVKVVQTLKVCKAKRYKQFSFNSAAEADAL